jgi:hypothetical protein
LNPRTIRAAALALLVGGLLAAAMAYASAFGEGGAPPWAGPLLGVAAMTGAALLAAARAGGGTLAALLLLGGAALAFGMASVWTVPPPDPAEPELYLGLPRAVAHLIFGIGLLPALVVPLVYAWTFDRATLSEEDLARVRDAATRRAPGSDA